METNIWKKCSSCKKEIPFSSMYYQCSISTCQHKRKGFQFCSVPCWDAHLGYANHRTKAYAEEVKAPSKTEVEAASPPIQETDRTPHRTIVDDSPSQASSSAHTIKTDTLVVVSKVKKLIKEQSGFNTSQCAVEALTKKVVAECLSGIECAKNSGRKTVMGRDIE